MPKLPIPCQHRSVLKLSDVPQGRLSNHQDELPPHPHPTQMRDSAPKPTPHLCQHQPLAHHSHTSKSWVKFQVLECTTKGTHGEPACKELCALKIILRLGNP